jgi:pimeloyl-ACP methyl ester carboxylesterase
MLHGWGRSLDALWPLGELLANRCRVLLVDLPGFGGSPAPHGATNEGGGWDTRDYCASVVQLLDQRGLGQGETERCVVLGHSLGGRIALRLGAQFSERVSALVLVAAAGIPRQRSPRERARLACIRWCVRTAKRIDGSFGTRLFPHYLANRFGSTDYRNAGHLRKTLVKTVNEDLSAEAAAISAPTLLLWGADDTETPVDVAHSMHQRIRGSELHVLPRKGHEPFADVGAHLVCRYIERFLVAHELLSEA